MGFSNPFEKHWIIHKKKSIILTISREQDQELIRVELSALARKERVKCLCRCGGDRAKVARGVRLAAGKVPTRPRHTCPAAGSPLEQEHSSPPSLLLLQPTRPTDYPPHWRVLVLMTRFKIDATKCNHNQPGLPTTHRTSMYLYLYL